MDKQLYSTNDPSASCTNMVNFGPVMPEIEVWEICTFEMRPISLNISTTTEPIFTNVSALVYVCMGITKKFHASPTDIAMVTN